MNPFIATAILLLTTTSAFGGGNFGKGLAGAGAGMQDWGQTVGPEMMRYEMQRQQDEAEYERQRQMRLEQQEDQRRESEARREQERREAADIRKVNEAHPGWTQTVKTKSFSNWMSRQPESVRRLADSSQAQDAILMLDLYKRDRGLSKTRH